MPRCVNCVKEMTTEKDEKLKESLKAMGFSRWHLWMSRFFYSFMLLFVVVIFMTLLLTLNIRETPVLVHSNRYSLLLFFIFASCSVITFGILISTLIPKANTVTAGLFFVFSEIPYVIHRHEDIHLANLLASCSMVGSAICYGVEVVVKFEAAEEGIRWDNLWMKPSPNGELALPPILVMMILDSLLYLVLAIYLDHVFPGDFGLAQPWYFLCLRSYWSKKTPAVEDHESETSSENLEDFSENLPIGIQLTNVSKTFANNEVVKNLNLKAYEGFITVLLGHRGAGKTTTLLMMIGMLPTTKGRIKVCEFNVRTDKQKVQDNIALCLQHNIFFDTMTVIENLSFFCRLKSASYNIVDKEIKRCIKILELEDKKNVLVANLSEGTKRQLNVAMALSGDTKVVILDEPSAGLDFFERKKVWELLQAYKQGRTIFFTTQLAEEALLLGDSIAIIKHGKLQCCGSTSFIKKKFASGYYLTLEVSQKCEPQIVTNMLKTHISSIRLHSHVDLEITYKLPEELEKYADLLQELETNKKMLNVLSFGIRPASVEEAFLKSDYQSTKLSKPTPKEDAIKHEQYLRGCGLILNQILAMSLKKVLCIYRAFWVLVITQVIIPVVIVLCFLFSTKKIMAEQNNFPVLPITLGSYQSPTIILIEGIKNPYYLMYEKVLKGYDLVEVSDIGREIIQKTTESPFSAKRRYIVAASFGDFNTTAWFSGNPFHSPPLALGLVLNTFFKKHLGEAKSISFVNHPLPLTPHAQLETFDDRIGIHLAFAIEYAMISITSAYILFQVREHICQSKNLQLVSGVNPLIFWSVSLLSDFLVYFIAVYAILMTVSGLEVEKEELTRLLILLIFFGFFILPFIYVLSHLFKTPSNSYSTVLMISFLTGLIGFSIVRTFFKEIDWILIFTPFYLLMSGIIVVSEAYNFRKVCRKFGSLKTACKEDDICCGLDNFYSLDSHGIGRHLLVAFLISLFFLSFLLFKEYGFFKFGTTSIRDKSPDQSVNLHDRDVEEEFNIIKRNDQKDLDRFYALVLRDVRKRYKRVLAVKGISLAVKPSECFGLLGVNGAGKTTTLRMMTGELVVPYGEIFVKGLKVEKNLKRVRGLVGYCPESDPFLEELTPKETLQIFALLRGVRLNSCSNVIKDLAQKFDFSDDLDTKIGQLTGDTKRKLSVALSLIGDPVVIFLDEPTVGMDPDSKSLVWNVLSKLKSTGKCIVLSSQDVEECEALCTRLAIMVKGDFQCLGSNQKLKNKFAKGYILTIKIGETDDLDRSVKTVSAFVRNNFPRAAFKCRYESVLNYHLDDSFVVCSDVFRIMEEEKVTTNILNYSLQKCDLKQVFQNFTPDQMGFYC